VVPAFDRDLVAPGTIKRVWEAIYVKLLVEDGAVHRPEAEHLVPETAALVRALGL
jgi:hypothetical protein